MNKELKKFLTAYLDWAEHSGEEGQFCTGYGLCDNLDVWCEDLHEDESWEVTEEFLSLLPKRPGSSVPDRFPFGKDDYYARSREGTLHECPLRLEFVRKTLKEAENDA